MKYTQVTALLISTIALSSCGEKVEKSSTPIGKYDSTVKGYIIEDLPKLNNAQLQNQLLNKELEPTLKWQHLDQDIDGMMGVSADKAYIDFNLNQEKEIIVAVIDSGVDVDHEDLREVMWVNKNEIPNNGIDDDKNGYIDDIYGWNFIGGADGSHINEETLEETRIYKNLLDKMQAGIALTTEETTLYNEVKEVVETSFNDYSKKYNDAKEDLKTVESYLDILKVKLGIQNVDSRDKIVAIESEDEQILKIKKELLFLWDKYWRGFRGIQRTIDMSKYYATVGYNINFDARAVVVGDDPSDFTDTNYGNNDVTGPDSGHGTHVAGIIAAKRNNKIGMNGIAANVKIMALRAVPNGDERDKDIALAVRYAADNGAKIINMSFGKKYSPYKAQVDAAFKYAASKGVLLVHAAGNSSKNIDGGINNFPNHYIKDGSGVLVANRISNWFEVGASTKNLGLDLIATFSNFGDEAVTFFSPGHRIYSTTPGNSYEAYSGTSMASPVAAGVAALLMSEFPSMKAFEAMNIINHTVAKNDELQVRKPSEDRSNPDFRIPVPFTSLSQKDGVINAYNAVKLAKELSNQ